MRHRKSGKRTRHDIQIQLPKRGFRRPIDRSGYVNNSFPLSAPEFSIPIINFNPQILNQREILVLFLAGITVRLFSSFQAFLGCLLVIFCLKLTHKYIVEVFSQLLSFRIHPSLLRALFGINMSLLTLPPSTLVLYEIPGTSSFPILPRLFLHSFIVDKYWLFFVPLTRKRQLASEQVTFRERVMAFPALCFGDFVASRRISEFQVIGVV